MSRNKYQRRRGMRPSTTAASAAQSELIQGPVTHSQSSTDLGREAARQIKEQNNPNTRYIDRPDATSNKNLLRQAQAQQQAAMGSVRRQVLGEGVAAPLKPSGTHRAPSIPVQPRQMQLVAKGGGIHLGFAPTVGANLAAAGAAYAIEQAAQPALEYLGEKLARGLYAGKEFLFGDDDGITFDDWQTIFSQVKKDVETKRAQGQAPTPEYVDSEIERLRKQIANINKPQPRFKPVEDSADVFKTQNLEAPTPTPEPSATQPTQEEPVVEEVPTEYQIRRAALGEQPTKEEIGAVLAYGLEQHRLNFPHLYKEKTPNPLMKGVNTTLPEQ